MVKWTPKSEKDLDLISEHIAKNFNVDLAIQTVNNIIDYTDMILSKNPLAGSVLTTNPLFSKLVYEGNTIYYCENPINQHIYIIYVQHRGSVFNKKRVNRNEVA